MGRFVRPSVGRIYCRRCSVCGTEVGEGAGRMAGCSANGYQVLRLGSQEVAIDSTSQFTFELIRGRSIAPFFMDRDVAACTWCDSAESFLDSTKSHGANRLRAVRVLRSSCMTMASQPFRLARPFPFPGGSPRFVLELYWSMPDENPSINSRRGG